MGSVGEVIDYYLNPEREDQTAHIPENHERYGTGETIFTSFYLTDLNRNLIDKVYFLQKFMMNFEFEVRKETDGFHQFVFWAQIADSQGAPIIRLSSIDDGSKPLKYGIGKHKISAVVDVQLLPGRFMIDIGLSNMQRNIDNISNVLNFEVSDIAEDGQKSYPWGEIGRAHV